MGVNVELVNKLIDRIEQEGTIPYRYIKKNEKGEYCYCAVGHAICVVGDRNLEVDYELAQEDKLDYGLARGIHEASVRKILGPSLEPYGLTYHQWSRVQEVNDNAYDRTRTADVVKVLKDIIFNS